MHIHLVSYISECLTYPSASHNHAYSFGVPCLQMSHISMSIHSVSHITSAHTFRHLTYPSAYSFGVSCICPTYPCLLIPPECIAHSSVPHIHACSFGVSCLRLSRISMPIRLVSHAYSVGVHISSTSHIHAYSFGVTCPCAHIIMPIRLVSHIPVPHTFWRLT